MKTININVAKRSKNARKRRNQESKSRNLQDRKRGYALVDNKGYYCTGVEYNRTFWKAYAENL